MLLLGCGYLGTALARVALAGGESVAALTRSEARASELRAMGLGKVVIGDIASDDWHDALEPSGQDIVFSVAPSEPNEAGYRRAFLDGAHAVGRWLESATASGKAPARSLVFTSSTSVYPQFDGKWVAEDSPFDASDLSPSGKILRQTEEIFQRLAPRLVGRVWILRLAGLYGPERHHLLDVLRAGETTFPGRGDHWLNLIHRDDAVRAIRACLSAPQQVHGGIFNVTDGEPATKKDVITWLAQQLGINTASIHFDASQSPRSAHRKPSKKDAPNRKISNKYLCDTLGFKPLKHSYREGYASLISGLGCQGNVK